MADIIVTTPKSEMRNAEREAGDCLRDGGGEYFRYMGVRPGCEAGDRIYYVEDGYVRGFAIVARVAHERCPRRCDTTGGWWSAGWYVFMDATSWQWIQPIPMKGFQGWRYARKHIFTPSELRYTGASPFGKEHPLAVVVGGWRDPRPKC
jgi:hypothetical protein